MSREWWDRQWALMEFPILKAAVGLMVGRNVDDQISRMSETLNTALSAFARERKNE